MSVAGRLLVLVAVLVAIMLALVDGPARGAPAPGSSPTRRAPAKRLSAHFGKLPGTFVFRDPQSRQTVRVAPQRAATQFTPCSTFKVPNSLIALQLKVAKDTGYFIAWDKKRDPLQHWWSKSWARDQTMASALPESVVWYFQELARRIGAPRMAHAVRKLRYGNMKTSGGVDGFWISDNLRISADEQVDFMQRFYRGRLDGIAPRYTRLLKPLLVLERGPAPRLAGPAGPGWVLSGKTGACPAHDKHYLGWLVGYLERTVTLTRKVGKKRKRRQVRHVYFYALNVSGYNYHMIASKRLSITKAILQDLGVLPRPARAP